ncbi:hypothetical protein [Hyphomicrobium sp. DY-1]|uniref:hypothetical protein n=1 Tax=Hyphomicrobium sp. DY-1 TaxID=3075650 RepID=UPI0039C18312
MTNTTPPRFKPALAKSPMPDFEAIASAVDAVATKNDVGNLTKPSAALASTSTPATPTPSDNVTALPPRKDRAPKKAARAEEAKLSLMVPVYLLEAIDKKRTRNKTKRFIVLQAFKDAGYEVREADFMEDGRRGRE